jgi:hypothetical protein
MEIDWDKWKARASSFGRFLLDYLELLFAGVLGVVAGVLGLAGDLHGDHLTEATVALIGVLAFAVIRERFQRHQLGERIDKSVGLLDATKPWQVLYEDLKWDLESRTEATATMQKELLIAQDEVFAIYEYQYTAPGADLIRQYQGGMKGGPLQDLPMIHENFPGPDGRFYRLISLERICRAGEIMRIESLRRLQGRFPGTRENVSKEVAMQTTRLSIEVVWPPNLKPRAVWIQRTDQPDQMINLSRLKRSGNRWRYKEDFPTPQPGERIALVWDW